MQHQFPWKTALVTGASGGIGGCIARECAKRGMRVVAVGRSRESLEALRAAGHPSTPVLPVEEDLLDWDAIAHLIGVLRTQDIKVDLLARTALFTLNTGARDEVVCGLRWESEIQVPELSASVFEVPAASVKGRRRSRLLVCNSAAQSVVESVRGEHDEYVFVYQRRKADGSTGEGRPHRVDTMNNTAWQRARRQAGLGDLHVHDLRHTTGMRLREAGVSDSTRADILWHTSPTMTHHYSMAQIVELYGALEKIKADSGAWNKSLATLKLEQQAGKRGTSPAKVPQQRKTG